MNNLIFHHDIIEKYYNCSGRTYEEWKALGHPNTVIGLIYGITGFIYLIFLLPFLLVFIKTDFIQYSCFKIMLLIAIIDTIEIPLGCLYCGYATYIGMVYCMSPMLNYVLGCILFACWTSASCSCMILGINRCLSIMSKKLSTVLFEGKIIGIWLFLPICSFLYFVLFHPPLIFNSSVQSYFFDPFADVPDRRGRTDNNYVMV